MGPEQATGMAFITGVPLIILAIGFSKGRKLLPVSIDFAGRNIVLEFSSGMTENISIEELKYVSINVHSQRTAYLELIYRNDKSLERRVVLPLKYYNSFIEMCRQVCRHLGDDQVANCYYVDGMADKDKKVYFFDEPWDVFLEHKKSFPDVFADLRQESWVRKVGALGFYFILFMGRVIRGDGVFSGMFWFLGIGYLMYLLTGFFMRLRGYSRKETIEGFFAGVFFFIMGFCPLVLNIAMLFGFRVS